MTSESLLIWGNALAITGAVVLGYVLTLRRRGRRDLERMEEARRLGIDTPKGQYPYIDPDVCIGCGGCISACPEGDVLGNVGGLATVVNGMRCIGIGQCVKACPVGGAIELRVGSLKGRADVPVMDDERETNVPGVFVAGELGGLALIRNAVEQGRETVRSIAERLDDQPAPSPLRSVGPPAGGRSVGPPAEPPPEDSTLDLAIVGAGPTGLSAALSAVEHRLSYVLLEQESDFGGTIFQYPRRKLTHTQPVELPLYGTLKREEYTKEELLELFSSLIDEHQLELRLGERVMSLDRTHHGTFQIRTATGVRPEGGQQSTFRARNVLLALGRRGTPRKLGVPGEQLPKVMYQVRDAAQYRRQRILCVGGGDSAIEAAMGLARQSGNRVAISYRKERFFRIKKKNEERLAKLVKRGRIQLIMQSQVLEINEGSVRLRTPDGETTLDNDFVFVLIGGIPPFKLLREFGIQFGDEISQAASVS